MKGDVLPPYVGSNGKKRIHHIEKGGDLENGILRKPQRLLCLKHGGTSWVCQRGKGGGD